MENLNRVLLENVLPAHVAEHFLARSLKNEVREAGLVGRGGADEGEAGLWGRGGAYEVRPGSEMFKILRAFL